MLHCTLSSHAFCLDPKTEHFFMVFTYTLELGSDHKQKTAHLSYAAYHIW